MILLSPLVELTGYESYYDFGRVIVYLIAAHDQDRAVALLFAAGDIELAYVIYLASAENSFF